MTGNQGHGPMLTRERRLNRTATRFKVNRNWNRRGDKHKPKAKK